MSKYSTGEDALKALLIPGGEDNHDPIHIIFHLKQRMKEKGLTQQQLAEMSGVRQATISQLCRGNVERLHIPTLEKIAAVMKITDISQLLSFLPESEIMSGGNPYDIVYENNNKDSSQ